jgi:hypothetical protein
MRDAGVHQRRSLVYISVIRWCTSVSFAGVHQCHSLMYISVVRWCASVSLAGVHQCRSLVYISSFLNSAVQNIGTKKKDNKMIDRLQNVEPE